MAADVPEPSCEEPTYSLGAVVRLTGLSSHLLRAWERRHGAVQPLRTPGGTRRYREQDVERLQHLAAAVAAGHPIRTIASLPNAELRRRGAAAPQPDAIDLGPCMQSLGRLDREETARLLGLQLAALGARRFAIDVAAPLLREVGDAWQSGRLDVASEHLASAVLRGLLGSALAAQRASASAPRILVATPSGELHEFGALIAAIVAAEAGGDVTYLGPNLPGDEICAGARRIDARVVLLSAVEIPIRSARRDVRQVREGLPEGCALWLGGNRAGDLSGIPDVEVLEDYDALTRKVALLHG